MFKFHYFRIFCLLSDLSKLSYGDGSSSLQQHHRFEKEKEKNAHGHNMCVCVCVCVCFLGLNFSQMEF